MGDLSWWERHLGPTALQAPAPSRRAEQGYPQKAVRWEPTYPPTGPRQDRGGQGQPGGSAEGTPQDRVQNQGFISKAPPSVAESGNCPNCNGPNFFRRKWAYKECAPLCTDCGYNGDLFTQSGTLLNAVGMRSSTPVAFARTDNPEAAPHFGMDASLATHDWSMENVR